MVGSAGRDSLRTENRTSVLVVVRDSEVRWLPAAGRVVPGGNAHCCRDFSSARHL